MEATMFKLCRAEQRINSMIGKISNFIGELEQFRAELRCASDLKNEPKQDKAKLRDVQTLQLMNEVDDINNNRITSAIKGLSNGAPSGGSVACHVSQVDTHPKLPLEQDVVKYSHGEYDNEVDRMKQSFQLVFLEERDIPDTSSHNIVDMGGDSIEEVDDEISDWETCSEASDSNTMYSCIEDDLESCIADDYEYMSNHFLGIYKRFGERENDPGSLDSYEYTCQFLENGLLQDYGGFIVNVTRTLSHLRNFSPQIIFCYTRFGKALYGLLCNDIKWNWIATCQESFIQMKRSISQGVVLYRVNAVGVYRPPSLILASS
uniref:Protein ORF A n=1 Tax=Lygus hesperus TaxID=30085 RepID=A0A0A9XWP1_LYGHE